MKSKIIAICTAGLMVMSTMNGCSSVFKKDVTQLPLGSALTQKEVTDYYANELSFATQTKRNLNVQKTKYELQSVSSSIEGQLKSLVSQTENDMQQASYDSADKKIIAESTYNYIKAVLNDEKLSNSKVTSVKQALGYYFVDVDYDIGPAEIGTIKPEVSLLGINGGFTQDSSGNDSINTAFITKGVSNLNSYYSTNGINRTVVFSGTNLKTNNCSLPSVKYTEASGSSGIGEDNRKIQLDAEEFNKEAGSSTSCSAYMPKLNTVFNLPSSSGTISGAGIYASGAEGLRQFGFNRSKLTGKATLRYVFKSSINNVNDISGVNIYETSSEITSGIDIDTNNVVTPSFLNTQLKELIERSDRAIVDNDLAALMDGAIYSDSGMAILTGYENLYAHVLRNISDVKRIIARDIKSKSYLIEVDTVRQEGPTEPDSYGTYKDTKYVVVQQVGDKFVITDSLTMSRNMTDEPEIDPYSSSEKQLVALDLAGSVSNENKTSIKELLSDLYKASTARILKGPKQSNINGKQVTITRGMYDCFDSDTSILSSTQKEYLNSTIRELLIKNGVDVSANYSGLVTEWVGGANNQAELITEELITYNGMTSATYLKTYYLVSDMSGKWVIDDMKILDNETKTGDELKQLESRIGSN